MAPQHARIHRRSTTAWSKSRNKTLPSCWSLMNPAPPPPQVEVAIVGSATAAPAVVAPAQELFHWQQLAPIPDSEGFAASFAGVSGDALILAGGANIVGD